MSRLGASIRRIPCGPLTTGLGPGTSLVCDVSEVQTSTERALAPGDVRPPSLTACVVWSLAQA
ncbi:hypothetical protein HMPREF0972_02639 [Actinomyces sp. oral taxon 848 str. F0332]|nr:hypothetical protein HMPREF0972_02639 [Actinomyces sp. oral taxon 848 str. F0332]